MKYSQLISFNPIEDVIQLVTAENKDKAREYVKTYVMSDSMAEALQAPMIDLLQKLEQLPPLDEESFKTKINDILSTYTKGKDAGKLRIVVKRRESED